MRATIRAGKCKTRAIRMAEVTAEDAAAADGPVAEDTGGAEAAWEAVKVTKSVRRCTNS